MNIDRQRLARLITTLRAAQSQIGAVRPDHDADEARFWDDFDDGVAVVQEIQSHEGPFLVRVRRPFWASNENTPSDAMFFFSHLSGGNEGHVGTVVNAVNPSDAYEFKTLSAAEVIAAQLGATVMTFQQLVTQLRAGADAGSQYAIDTLNDLLPRNGVE